MTSPSSTASSRNSSYRYNFLQPFLKHLLLEAIDPIKNYGILYFRTLFGISIKPRNVVESVLDKRTQGHPESAVFDTIATVLAWLSVQLLALVSLPFRILFGILREIKFFVVAVWKRKMGAWANDVITRALQWLDFQFYLISELAYWLATPVRKFLAWWKTSKKWQSFTDSLKESLRVGVDKKYYNPISFLIATIGFILLVLYIILKWHAHEPALPEYIKVRTQVEQQRDQAQKQIAQEERLKASMEGMMPTILAGNGQDKLTPEQLVGVRKMFLLQFELEDNDAMKKILIMIQSFSQILIFSYIAKVFFKKESFNNTFVLGFYCFSIVLLTLQLADLIVTIRQGWVQSKDFFHYSLISYLFISILLPITYYSCYFATAPQDNLSVTSRFASVIDLLKRALVSLVKTVIVFALSWVGSWLPIAVGVSFYLNVPLWVILTI